MKIVVNSLEREVPDAFSVVQLLELLKLSNTRVAVEVNAELVTRAEWDGFKLKPMDKVEVVTFVGGG